MLIAPAHVVGPDEKATAVRVEHCLEDGEESGYLGLSESPFFAEGEVVKVEVDDHVLLTGQAVWRASGLPQAQEARDQAVAFIT